MSASNEFEEKKDLTSLIDLAHHSAQGTESTPTQENTAEPALEAMTEEPLTQQDNLTPADTDAPPIHSSNQASPFLEQNNFTETTQPVQQDNKKEDLAAIRNFGEHLSIGKPKIEANPAFSLLLTGTFKDAIKNELKNALSAEDYGLRYEDIEVQFAAGKVLIPRISEFAAISLAQKIYTLVDNIELDLSSKIFQASDELTDETLIDEDHTQTLQEEFS